MYVVSKVEVGPTCGRPVGGHVCSEQGEGGANLW